LAETGLLPEWAQKKVDMGKEAFNQFIKKNEDNFYEALEKYQKNKQVRRRKRAKKRSKLNGRNQAIIIDTSEEDTPSTHRKQTKQQKYRQQTAKSDSEDDKPLIPFHHQKRKKQQETGSLAQPDGDLFVENHPVPRRGPLLQSSDDEAGSSSDKNKNNLRQKTITQTRTNKELNLSKSVVDPDKTKSMPTLPLRKPVAERAPSGAQAQIRSPESWRKPTASDRPAGAKTTDLRQEHGRSSGAAAQSSAITNRIKMTNEPKTHRSQWNTEGQYKKLSTRRNAEKRSRIEGTPDLNALEFVGSHLPNFGRRKSTAPTDNPYARREAGTRGIQESDMDRTSQRQPNDQAEPLHDWEAEKVPLVCPDWRLSNNCPFPAKDCRFLHRNTDANGNNLEIGHISGKVPPKYLKRPLTCFFWMQDPSGCNKSADECLYAHKNTGWMPQSAANPEPIVIDLTALPVSENFASRSRGGRHTPPIKGMKSVEKTCWFWANGGCNKPEGECRFKHYDTGIMSSLPMCSFFLKGACRSSAEECKYSHVAPGQPDVNNDTIFTTLVPQELMQQPPAERTQDYQRDTQRVVQSSVVDHSATNEEQQRVSTSTVLQLAVDSAMTSVLRPATTSSSSLKQSIEQTLRITFNDLFEWGDDGVKRMMLDRKAYLLFHPEEHLEQLDVITRWLLMHHVEVSSHWFQGGWEYYKQQIANGGSGIVIVSDSHLRSIPKTANTFRCTPTLSTSRVFRTLVSYYRGESAYGHLGITFASSTTRLQWTVQL
jgi:chromo domain-containing protein 1